MHKYKRYRIIDNKRQIFIESPLSIIGKQFLEEIRRSNPNDFKYCKITEELSILPLRFIGKRIDYKKYFEGIRGKIPAK